MLIGQRLRDTESDSNRVLSRGDVLGTYLRAMIKCNPNGKTLSSSAEQEAVNVAAPSYLRSNIRIARKRALRSLTG